MAENENLASILVKSGLNSIFTDSPKGYFSKFGNDYYTKPETLNESDEIRIEFHQNKKS